VGELTPYQMRFTGEERSLPFLMRAQRNRCLVHFGRCLVVEVRSFAVNRLGAYGR
jgi:hypothetical protein